MGRRKIEGYEGLTIDKEGEVVNEETGKEVRQRELRGTVVISYKGSVLEVYKLILKAFNPYELENVSNYDVLSSRRIKYKDGNKWNLKLENIEVKEGFLEYLNNGRDDIYFTNRKEIDSMWEYEENIKRGLNPKKLNIKSTRKAKWKCDKGHSFEDEIKNVLRREIKCRECFEDRRKLNKRKEKDRCVLPITQTHTEDIKAYWDYDKNGKIRPTDYTYGATKEVWWKCEYGHSYRKPIHRQLYTKRCMECSKWGKVSIPQQVVYNVLRNNFKHVEMEKPFGKYRGDIYLGDEEILIEYDGIAFHKGKEKIKKDVQRDIQILQKENNNVRKIIRIRETGETHTREVVEGVELVNYDSTRDIKERGYRDLIKVTEYLIKAIKGECTTLRYEDMDIYTNTIWSSKATNLFDKFPHLIEYFGIKNKEDTNLITYGSEMWFEWECQKCGNSWEEQPIKISKRKEINVCRRCKKERELNVGEEDKKRRLELIKKRKKKERG